MHEFGLGLLYSLGCEVFGRWDPECISLLEQLADQRSRNKLWKLRLLARWSGLLSISLQRAVSNVVLADHGGDLPITLLENVPGAADFNAGFH